MPGWNGRSRGSRLGYSIFIFLLKQGGLKPAYFLLRLVSAYYVFFASKATRPLKELYVNRLHFPKKKARKTIRRNIYVFGQTLIDKIVVMANIRHNFTVTKTDAHYLDELSDAGKGGILVSAHLGNWELAGHLLQRLDSAINIVMYDGEAEQVKQYLDKITGPKTFRIIFIREDLSHIYEMSAALARNELICIHADRFVTGNRTIEHEFLGENAYFPLGPFILASKLKAPVCFVFAFKEAARKYHFYAYPPKVYEGRGTLGAAKMLEDYVALLEEKVKQYPEQWFNYYDFWQKPSGNTKTV
jgi:predicted LPLAT superfamily acyltransferase